MRHRVSRRCWERQGALSSARSVSERNLSSTGFRRQLQKTTALCWSLFEPLMNPLPAKSSSLPNCATSLKILARSSIAKPHSKRLLRCLHCATSHRRFRLNRDSRRAISIGQCRTDRSVCVAADEPSSTCQWNLADPAQTQHEWIGVSACSCY